MKGHWDSILIVVGCGELQRKGEMIWKQCKRREKKSKHERELIDEKKTASTSAAMTTLLQLESRNEFALVWTLYRSLGIIGFVGSKLQFNPYKIFNYTFFFFKI